jgi:outer membrane immunogenic protein
MKKCGLGLLGLTLTSVVAIASANAADMYVPTAPGGYKDAPWAPTWAGFYVGVNGGGAFDDKSGPITFTNSTAQVFTSSKSLDASGGFGGGQIGYNWQGALFGPRVVLGVEADFQGGNINSSFSGATVTGFSDIWAGKRDVDWFGTVRGRLGYSFGQALLYATGGFAYGDVRDKLDRTGPAGASFAFASNDSVRTGFVVGGGLEYSLSPAWSAKLEYQYIDFGSEKLTGSYVQAGPLVTIHTNALDDNFSTVRVGLNYHIAPAYVPLK